MRHENNHVDALEKHPQFSFTIYTIIHTKAKLCNHHKKFDGMI